MMKAQFQCMNSRSSNRADTTLITGASGGIGLALAREFARHGHPVVIVPPVAAELQEIAAQIREQFGVTVTPLAADLNRNEAADQLFDRLMNHGISVEILVNNAGLGQRGSFWETPLERDIEIIRVNVEAPIRLTNRFCLP